MTHPMLRSPVVLVALVTTLCLLFVIIYSDRVRSNLRKNLSFIVVLHHALKYQQKKVQNNAEFANEAAENQAREQDFHAFTVALPHHYQQKGRLSAGAAVRHRADVTQQRATTDAASIQKIIARKDIRNVPLAFCLDSELSMPYALWSKCVETATHYYPMQGAV